MNALCGQRERWQTLLGQPLNFIAEANLAQCFAGPLSVGQLQALRQLPRFEVRVLRLLLARFGLQPLSLVAEPAAADLPVLLLPPEAFPRLARLCGAIWHGATLRHEIRSDVVNELRRLLGSEVFAAALAHRQQAGAADLLRQPAQLLEAIDHDGARCVSAWLQAQPQSLSAWLRLRLPDPALNDGAVAFNPQIVRSAAATMAADFAKAAEFEVSP